MVMIENLEGKRPFGQPRLRWEDVVDVEPLNVDSDWKARAANKKNWRFGCMTGWS